MPVAIHLVVSIDHDKKKTQTISVPFFLYLHLLTSDQFIDVLPDDLAEKFRRTQKAFENQNGFLSSEYQQEYEQSPFIRFLTGPDIHKFLTKLLSVNYQSHKSLLQEIPGSFTEFFADLDLFWNPKYKKKFKEPDTGSIRHALFCYACLNSQFTRVNEKKILRENLDEFARSEISARDEEIKRLQRELDQQKLKNEQLDEDKRKLEEKLFAEEEKNMVLVPSDPYYMLGLKPGHKEAVDHRAKLLMKALHPDRSGEADTAFLFDMVLKARDQILK